MTDSPTPLTPEMIEQFRQIGLRLDRNGVFWHQGSPIEHPRLTKALLRWLDIRPSDGRPIVRLDERRYAYVDVDDAMLLVTSILWRGDEPIAVLNDGTEEPLACDTLAVANDDALYCEVRDRQLKARITPSALLSLMGNIEESEGVYGLNVGGELFPITPAE